MPLPVNSNELALGLPFHVDSESKVHSVVGVLLTHPLHRYSAKSLLACHILVLLKLTKVYLAGDGQEQGERYHHSVPIYM